MASTPETELTRVPEEKEVSVKKKRKPLASKGKAQSVNVSFKNVHNGDLEVGGFLIKSGTSRKFVAHIGEAIKQTPVVSNYIRLGWLEVS